MFNNKDENEYYNKYHNERLENAKLILEIERLQRVLSEYRESVFTLQAKGFTIKYNTKDKFIQVLNGIATPQQVYSAVKEHWRGNHMCLAFYEFPFEAITDLLIEVINGWTLDMNNIDLTPVTVTPSMPVK